MYSSDSATHSIFITSVTGNSFTYADCNADIKNQIAWNKRGSVSRSNGNLTITLSNKSMEMIWVERPVMIGDANGDSVIDQNDVYAIDNVINGSISYDVANKVRAYACDLNKDGKVTSTDKNLLKNSINSSGYLATYNFVR